ncbi:hypothetical protein QTP86_003667 [Hemibagrus guttatus]|nr:hypothetical protein QTP86_003667 [Hemibagrus guttatus]
MQRNSYMVLCECKETVRGECVPSEIFPDNGAEPWLIIRADEALQTDVPGFNQKLAGLMQAEGKTLNDLRTLFPGEEPVSNPTEAILRAVMDLLDKTAKPTGEQCLTHAPVLASANPEKPYILHIDASLKGLGAMLYQEYAEGLRPVAFASRKLSTSERNYPIHQLEFLALKWAKFHEYLYGARFTVCTDNNPLTYVLSTAKLSAVGHRWLAALSTYEFDIQYWPGQHNIDADLLSRNMADMGEAEEWVTLPESGVKDTLPPWISLSIF